MLSQGAGKQQMLLLPQQPAKQVVWHFVCCCSCFCDTAARLNVHSEWAALVA